MTHESEISKCGKVKCSSSHINVSMLFFGTFLRLFFGFHRFRLDVIHEEHEKKSWLCFPFEH